MLLSSLLFPCYCVADLITFFFAVPQTLCFVVVVVVVVVFVVVFVNIHEDFL